MTHRILIVDDDSNMRELISLALTREGYSCHSEANASSGLLEFQKKPYDIVISDIKMPGEDGVWLLKQLKRFDTDTCIIMLSAIGETEVAINCLTSGADSYLIKPVNLEELVVVLQKVLEKHRLIQENRQYQTSLERKVVEQTQQLKKALHELQASYQATLEALVAALDAREHETSNHSKRVAAYTVLLAQKMNVKKEELREISKGALLHDIGKIGIADAILLKPGKLTLKERLQMRQHPEIGAEILRRIGFSKTAIDIVYSHQERYDGSGYPRGLKGDAIPLGARIFAVADTFDSMTNDRPYRRALSFERSREEIKNCSRTQFDPKVVDTFLKIQKKEWAEITKLHSRNQSRDALPKPNRPRVRGPSSSMTGRKKARVLG